MKGYKAFNKGLCCRGFQYEVGQTYTLKGELEICKNGFHFCETIADCYNYYPTNGDTRICEVDALGEVLSEGNKYCTDKILIVREIVEAKDVKCNADNSSIGYFNTGSQNTGHKNSGNCNSGNCNSGNMNSGDWNSGNHNSGNHNSGNMNSGRWNSGNMNSGNMNSGDWNSGDHNSGFFCTIKNPKLKIFDAESDLTFIDVVKSKWYAIMCSIPSDNRQAWYDRLDDSEKGIILNIPNFDACKFKECTGIDVRKEKRDERL